MCQNMYLARSRINLVNLLGLSTTAVLEAQVFHVVKVHDAIVVVGESLDKSKRLEDRLDGCLSTPSSGESWCNESTSTDKS